MEDKDKIKDLTHQRMVSHLIVTEAYQSYQTSQKETICLRKEWERSRDGYEKIDRELAMIDGRFQKVKTKHQKKETPMPTLTMEQVYALAKRVGIELKEG